MQYTQEQQDGFKAELAVKCSVCGQLHDVKDLEPSFRRPDAFLEIPQDERAYRTLEQKDLCAIRDAADSHRRYFLRVLLPIPVHGQDYPCSWGIWVEISERDFERTRELWSDPACGNEPPFPGRLANRAENYPPTLGLSGWVQLVSPAEIPIFTLEKNHDHPLARE